MSRQSFSAIVVEMSDAASLEPFLKPAIRAETFRERGVSVPFTTPFLFGARLRGGEDGRARELVVANPYGGAGVYVLPASNVKNVCSPTVHDRLLLERLDAETDLSPCSVRRLAFALGVEGYAGRLVRRAMERTRREREALHEGFEASEAVPAACPLAKRIRSTGWRIWASIDGCLRGCGRRRGHFPRPRRCKGLTGHGRRLRCSMPGSPCVGRRRCCGRSMPSSRWPTGPTTPRGRDDWACS